MLNRRLTGALAWGGLALILAVPSAEMLSANVGGQAANSVSEPKVEPVESASAEPPARRDPVEDFISGGQDLPTYISEAAPAPARTVPATGTPAAQAATGSQAAQTTPVAPNTQATLSTQVAALPSEPAAAPIPMPARMRPLPPATQTAVQQPAPATANELPQVNSTGTIQAPQTAAAQPAPTAPVQTQPLRPAQTAVAQPAPSTPEAPVIVDEEAVEAREVAVARPVPPADVPEVTEDELEEWDSGSLADYLERRGLMSETSSNAQSSADYDPDGFFLSDGPNDGRTRVYREGNSILVFPED